MSPRVIIEGYRAGLARRLCRQLAGQAGTAAVEFALILPLLMVLLLGTVEVGFVILSRASMTATLARVPDLALQSPDVAALQVRLERLSETRAGLGLGQVVFDAVTETCLCPTAVETGLDGGPCPADCAGGVRLYTLTGRVSGPSLIPGGSSFGGRTLSARLTVPGP
jgi:Flp pilus assembly pilin Flp